MLERLRSVRDPLMLAAIVILGILLFFWPTSILMTLCRIAGIVLLVMAVAGLWPMIRNHTLSEDVLEAVIFCVAAILGLFLLRSPASFLSFLPSLIGLALMIYGGIRFYGVWTSTRDRMSLVLHGVTVALGLFLSLNPLFAVHVTGMAVGGVLVYTGVSGIIAAKRGL